MIARQLQPCGFYKVIFISIIAIGTLCAGCQSGKQIPVEQGLYRINGTEIYIKTMGEGTPIVILHGGPGLDHSYFLPQFKDLAKDHKLIFFDQRASGKSSSDLDSTGISLSHFIDDIEAVRNKFGLEKMNLLGHSWGGLLAMLYAVEHPQNLRSLMLINATPASQEMANQGNAIAARRRTIEDSTELAALLKSEAMQKGESKALEAFLRIHFRQTFHNRTLIDSLTLNLPEKFSENSKKLRYLYKDLLNYDIHEDLEEISCPTLILTGDHDDNPLAAYDMIHKQTKNSELIVLENCGHFPFIEAKVQFFSLLRSFLQKK